MNTRNYARIRLVVLGLFCAALGSPQLLADDVASSSHHNAKTRIEFFPNIGPTRVRDENGEDLIKSPSFDQYASNAITAILQGKRQMGGDIDTTPTAFQTLNRPFMSPGEIIATGFNTWRGDLNPTGAFANETGTFWRLGIRIISKQRFTLNEVRKIYSDSLDADEYTMAETIGTFEANRAVGISWGADGIPGNGDDIVYDSDAFDAATTPLNVFAWIGNGKLDFITAEFLDEYFDGDKELFFDDWTLFLSGDYPGGPNFNGPFYFKYLYEVGAPGNVRARARYRAHVKMDPVIF